MKPEAMVQRDITQFLKKLGCAVYSTSQGYRKDRGGTRTSPGIPDLIVLHPDAWTFAELKVPKGRLSPAQEGFRTACLDAGAPWECWRSVDDCWEWCVEHGLVEEAA
jgi:hypothetical protein